MPEIMTRAPGVAEGREDASHVNAQDRVSFPWRRAAILFLPIAVLLSPFLFHRSKDAVIFGYSWDYLLLLAAVGLAGSLLSVGIIWLVKRAPADRQLGFAFILLGFIVASLLSAELLLGYLGRDRFADGRIWGQRLCQFTGFENVPNHKWHIVGATYTTDANTFRTHPTSRVAPEEETLIVVMGGSCVFGHGLDDDETWAQRLESRLRDRFDDRVTVLNAGNNGHTSLQQLIRFYNRVLPLDPDFVVYYGAINDVRPNRLLEKKSMMHASLPEAITARRHLQANNDGRGFYFENSLLLGRAVSFVEKWQRKATVGIPTTEELWTLGPEDYSKTAATYVQNLETLRMICQANGIEFVPATFLVQYEGLPLSLDVGTKAFTDALRDRFGKQGYRLVDLWPAFEQLEDKTGFFLPDRHHPTAEGAAFIAAHLAEALTPLIQHRMTAENPSPPQVARASTHRNPS